MKNVLVVFLLFLGLSASAQEVYTSSGKKSYKHKSRKGYDPDKLIIGGGLNGGFSNGYINAGVSPIVGYRISRNFSAGVGLGYQYYRDLTYIDPYNNSYYSTEHIIYPSVWMRYFLFRNVFISGNFEYDFINGKDPLDHYGNLNTTPFSASIPCALVGAGMRQHMGGRVSFIGEILYDALQRPGSPYYGQPVIRVGIVAGL